MPSAVHEGSANTSLEQKSFYQLTYLDFSLTSLDIARTRAKYRGLENIKWENAMIEIIPQKNLGKLFMSFCSLKKRFSGKFDFIECSCVLHHLPDPDKGLQILADSLKEEGGIYLILYGL